MGLWQRFTMIFKTKANKALDRAEDPRETLDYSYQRQLDMLTKVRRGVADVATSRKRVEMQLTQLTSQQTKLGEQAQKAIDMGREDLAREALTRKSGLNAQVTDLQAQVAQLQGEEEKLHRCLPPAADQGGLLPHPEGDDQGHLHGRRGADQDQRGLLRHRWRDG